MYYTDTQKNLVCIDAKDLPAGTVIQMQNSNNTRSLTDTIRQSGVYEAGSGYAVFTSIDIAAKNEDTILQETVLPIRFPIMTGLY